MKPQSAKAKGRKLQQEVRDAILKHFPSLQEGDVRSTSMGAGGEDILLSPAAKQRFPFSVECKNVEAINIHKALQQAEAHGVPEEALVVFRRNRSATYAALRFDTLLKILGDAYGT